MGPPEKASLLLGFSMGGFLDFVVLHLVLQWHHMISNRLPPVTLEALQTNIFWDGIGQSAMWVLTLLGIVMLMNAARVGEGFPPVLRFWGLFIVGWGIFNLLDGVVNHFWLALHNVREDVPDRMAWNMGYMLVAGILWPLFGWSVARTGRSR